MVCRRQVPSEWAKTEEIFHLFPTPLLLRHLIPHDAPAYANLSVAPISYSNSTQSRIHDAYHVCRARRAIVSAVGVTLGSIIPRPVTPSDAAPRESGRGGKKRRSPTGCLTAAQSPTTSVQRPGIKRGVSTRGFRRACHRRRSALTKAGGSHPTICSTSASSRAPLGPMPRGVERPYRDGDYLRRRDPRPSVACLGSDLDPRRSAIGQRNTASGLSGEWFSFNLCGV